MTALVEFLAAGGQATPVGVDFVAPAAQRLAEVLSWVIEDHEEELMARIAELEGDLATASEQVDILRTERDKLRRALSSMKPSRWRMISGAQAAVIAATLTTGVAIGAASITADAQGRAAEISADAQGEAAQITTAQPGSPAANGPTVHDVIDLANDVFAIRRAQNPERP